MTNAPTSPVTLNRSRGEKLPAPPADYSNDHLTDEQIRDRLRGNMSRSLPAWADERSRRIWKELGR